MEMQCVRMGMILFASLFLFIRKSSSEVDLAGGQSGDDIWNSTWIISPDHLCPTATTQDCSCSSLNRTEFNHFSVKCSCQDPFQIVNVERGLDLKSPMGMTLMVENCSHVRIHPHAFASIDGTLLEIQFSRIRHLEILESAFEINPQTVSRNLVFHNVSIPRIPPKGFPSSLSLISFLQSHIGLVAPSAFKGKTLQTILFQDSTLETISSEAFHEEILINNSWTVERCVVGVIEQHGIESSITNMTWTESTIRSVESYAMSGIIPSATFTHNIFKKVGTNGLTLKEWTLIKFINNSFGVVGPSGIDLTFHSAQFSTLLQGNSWGEVGLDFIKVGPSNSTPFAVVRENQFLQECSCSSTFIPQVTLNGSSEWFQEEMWNNSECQTTPKGAICLGHPGQLFTSYAEWPLLCSETTFLCTHELSEVGGTGVVATPQLTGRLGLLVIILGTVGLAIAIALIGVFCIYVCRREKSREKKEHVEGGNHHGNHPNYNGIHQGNHGNYHVYHEFQPTKEPAKVSGMRPRSSIFEDVEMEDKGVQTMPSELSSEVLQRLRDKLADPESFWDAKETFDHPYDIIHVLEESIPSPPDVTVLSPSGGNWKVPQSTSTPSHPPPLRSSSLAQGQGHTEVTTNGPRYAQIRSKPKTVVLLPTDGLQSNDYAKVRREGRVCEGSVDFRSESAHPTMCDYTEPQDVQTHVYAELNSFSNFNPSPRTGGQGSFLHGNKTFCVQRPRPMGRLTTSPTPPIVLQEGSLSPQQRPLPSIPPPFSTNTLK